MIITNKISTNQLVEFEDVKHKITIKAYKCGRRQTINNNKITEQCGCPKPTIYLAEQWKRR